jgi:hypothetical protein
MRRLNPGTVVLRLPLKISEFLLEGHPVSEGDDDIGRTNQVTEKVEQKRFLGVSLVPLVSRGPT